MPRQPPKPRLSPPPNATLEQLRSVRDHNRIIVAAEIEAQRSATHKRAIAKLKSKRKNLPPKPWAYRAALRREVVLPLAASTVGTHSNGKD